MTRRVADAAGPIEIGGDAGAEPVEIHARRVSASTVRVAAQLAERPELR